VPGVVALVSRRGEVQVEAIDKQSICCHGHICPNPHPGSAQ
jgi:hypothetical protein